MALSPVGQRVLSVLAIVLLGADLLVSAFLVPAEAQVTPPLTSSGLNTQISAPTPVTGGKTQYDITGGTRPNSGPNLFHSFGKFDVPTNNIANFLNDTNTPTTNILSRVTGGTPSNIFGTIQTTGFPGAHLFLMNPAGVVFGPTAQLNVEGSFHVTTADYLRMTDGAKFHADTSKASTLSVAPVQAFGFLSKNPTPISIQGTSLAVGTGNMLSLIGGHLTIEGSFFLTGIPTITLDAPSGRINLGSVASTGELVLGPSEQGHGLQMEGFNRFGTITILPGSIISTSGESGGAVVIRGGQLSVDNSLIFADTLGNQNGLPLAIDVLLMGDMLVTNGSFVSADALQGGNAGKITLNSERLQIDHGAVVGSHAVVGSSGDGGRVEVHTGDLLLLSDAKILSTTNGPGKAGDVVITAGHLTVAEGAQLANATFGPGEGGSVRIVASGAVNVSGTSDGSFTQITTQSHGLGGAGDISVTAQSVTVDGGAQVGSATFGAGRGGSVGIVATDTVNVSGVTVDGMLQTQLSANTFGTGPAGDITIAAQNITIKEGGAISSSTNGPGDGGSVILFANTVTLRGTGAGGLLSSGLFSQALGGEIGSGGAGTIVVTAENVTVSDGAQVSSGTFGPGRGGTVRLTATNTIDVSGRSSNGLTGSHVSASSNGTEAGSGDAGDVVVTARKIIVAGGAEISSVTFGPQAGGSVLITAADSVIVSGAGNSNPSLLSVSTESMASGAGAGGQLLVTANNIILTEGGQVSSTSFGAGQGGTVTLNATEAVTMTGTFADFPSGIFARAAGMGEHAGNGGNIVVTGRNVTVSGGGRMDSATLGAGQGGTLQVTATENLRILGTSLDGRFASGLFAGTESDAVGAGHGGNLKLTARNVIVSGGGQVSSNSFGPGEGGSILVFASTIDLTQASSITARGLGAGNAGIIDITAADQLVVTDSSVTTEAGLADGGNISLRADNLIHLTNTTVSSSVGNPDITTTTGGNIFIDPQFVILDNSRILANAFAGTGGNIHIVAGVLLVDPLSVISASSTTGVSGTITIQSPLSNLSGTLAPLPQTFLRTGALLSSRCVARLGGPASSFVVAGRDAIPMEPGGLLPSPLPEHGLRLSIPADSISATILPGTALAAGLTADLVQGCGS